MPGMTHWQSPRFFAWFGCAPRRRRRLAPPGATPQCSCWQPALARTPPLPCVPSREPRSATLPRAAAPCACRANTSPPSLVADMLCGALSVIGFSWIASPAATELEAVRRRWGAQQRLVPGPQAQQAGGGLHPGHPPPAPVLPPPLPPLYKCPPADLPPCCPPLLPTSKPQVVMDWLAKLLCLPPRFLAEDGGTGVIQSTASEATLVRAGCSIDIASAPCLPGRGGLLPAQGCSRPLPPAPTPAGRHGSLARQARLPCVPTERGSPRLVACAAGGAAVGQGARAAGAAGRGRRQSLRLLLRPGAQLRWAGHRPAGKGARRQRCCSGIRGGGSRAGRS